MVRAQNKSDTFREELFYSEIIKSKIDTIQFGVREV